MTKDEVTKIWWELTTEWEKMKGQLKESFDEKMNDLRKEELEQIVGAMTQIAERNTKTLEHLDKFSKVMCEATTKIAQALVTLRTRLDEVEALIVKRLDK